MPGVGVPPSPRRTSAGVANLTRRTTVEAACRVPQVFERGRETIGNWPAAAASFPEISSGTAVGTDAILR